MLFEKENINTMNSKWRCY